MTDCNKVNFKALLYEFKFIYSKYLSDAFAARAVIYVFTWNKIK